MGFSKILFKKVPREENVCANLSSKLSVGEPMETLQKKKKKKALLGKFISLKSVDDWTQPIKDFILYEKLPDDEKQARKFAQFLQNMF